MAKAIPYLDDLQRPPGRLNLLACWRARRPPRTTVRGDAAAPPAAPAAWAGASRIDSELWPVLEQAARSPASPQGAVCDLRGDPPTQPLRVALSEAELHALLAHLGAITAHALGAHVRPRAAARAEGAHAVLHWVGPDDAAGGLRLARLFTRLASCAVAPVAAERTLHASIREVQRMAHACGGRAYAAPSPFAVMGLTVRLPLGPIAAASSMGAARP
ncbi:MAG: hypothetical protein JSR41_03625 [Proteobacteria bacterium]|nr:hypothetical protein [Pseudomonadota bacterium]